MRFNARINGVLTAFTMMTALPAFAETPVPPSSVPPPPPLAEMMEHWQRATVSLGHLEVKEGKQRYTTLGSAVFVAVDEHHGCLLTARHMVDDPQHGWMPAEIQMRLARSPTATQDDVGVTVPLVVNNVHVWKAVEGTDLAIIPPPPDLSNKYGALHAVGINDFGSTEDEVFQGAPVLVLGYPGVIGEDPLSFPIARSGIVAWTDPNDRLHKPFLVDANLMPGNSGGPVFHVRNGLNRFGSFVVGAGLALIGIVSKGPEQDVKIQMQTPRGPADVLQFKLRGLGGIGVIEPAANAKMLIEQNCGS
jgi:hypothetical protein